jgi:hypothetical protein
MGISRTGISIESWVEGSLSGRTKSISSVGFLLGRSSTGGLLETPS